MTKTWSAEELMARYGEAISAGGKRRKSALKRLYVLSSRLRRSGLADEANPAIACLRRWGIPARSKVAHGLLGELGILEDLKARGLNKLHLDRYQQLLRLARADATERGSALPVRPEDVPDGFYDKYLSRQKKKGARTDETGRARERRILRAVLVRMGAGASWPMPSALIDRRTGPSEGLAGPAAHDLALVETTWKDLGQGAETRPKLRYSVLRIWRLLEQRGYPSPGASACACDGEVTCGTRKPARGGPIEALLDDEVVKEVLPEYCRPLPSGERPTTAVVDEFFKLLRHVSLAAGVAEPEIRYRKERLETHFGKRGKKTYLHLPVRQMAKVRAPSDDDALRFFSLLQDEIELSRATNEDEFLHLLGVRDMCLTICLTAMRAASLVAMRADRIRCTSSGVWFVEDVLVKATPNRQEPLPFPDDSRDGRTYSGWYLPAVLIPLQLPRLTAHGIDLLRWISSGGSDRSALRWVTARKAKETTFGDEVPGEEIAPFWFQHGGSYRSRESAKKAITRLIRRLMKYDKGGPHLFRHYAAWLYRVHSQGSADKVEALTRMSPPMQVEYRKSWNRNPADIVGSWLPRGMSGDLFTPFGSELVSVVGLSVPPQTVTVETFVEVVTRSRAADRTAAPTRTTVVSSPTPVIDVRLTVAPRQARPDLPRADGRRVPRLTRDELARAG